MSGGGYAGDVTILAVHVTADPAAALSLSLPAEENRTGDDLMLADC